MLKHYVRFVAFPDWLINRSI